MYCHIGWNQVAMTIALPKHKSNFIFINYLIFNYKMIKNVQIYILNMYILIINILNFIQFYLLLFFSGKYILSNDHNPSLFHNQSNADSRLSDLVKKVNNLSKCSGVMDLLKLESVKLNLIQKLLLILLYQNLVQIISSTHVIFPFALEYTVQKKIINVKKLARVISIDLLHYFIQ